MNMGVQIFFWDIFLISLNIFPEVELLDHMVVLLLIFEDTSCCFPEGSLVAQTVKSLPALWETWVHSLGQEDPLEKEMATTPVFLPGKSHGWRSPRGHKELDTTERLHFLLSFVLFSRVPVQFHQQGTKIPFSPHLCRHLLSFVSLMLAILMDVRWYLIVVYICISLMSSGDEDLFICLSHFSKSVLEKCLFRSIAHFIVGLFYFWY